MTTVCLIAPALTAENQQDLLAQACGKSKREVELLVATLRPQPDVATSVRKWPPPRPVAMPAPVQGDSVACPPPSPSNQSLQVTNQGATAPPARSVIAPLAPERYKVQLTVSRDTYDKLRRAQDLLRHAIPAGDPAAILDRALTLLIADLERKKFAATSRPCTAKPSKKDSRHVPAAVRREVWKRDGGCCAFVDSEGRCAETGFVNSIMSFHLRTEERPPSRTSSYAAAHTTHTRRSSGSGRCS